MADEPTADAATTDTVTADATEGTLLTDGPERKPDEGEGERKPDEGEGEKKADDGVAEKGEADEGAKEDDDDEEGDAEGAPEEYADFAAPEGVELDTDALDAFKSIAKEDNLSQAKAQRYVDAAAQMMQNASKQLADSILETRQSWLDAAKGDSEFGGDKLDTSLATAKRALDAYGSPALRELLDTTGLGNHPEIVRLLVKAGATVAEDKIISGDKAGNAPATLADRLYPNQAQGT